MKLRSLLVLGFVIGTASPALAAAGDADMYKWEDPAGCEYLMTTNHFELGPGESVELPIYLMGCPPEQQAGFIFFGYRTTRNSSRPLRTKDKVSLSCMDLVSGDEASSKGGSLYLEIEHATSLMLRATNDNRKAVTIRLRSQSGL